jgi:branched-chain amino acid transport system permease protein
MIEYIQVLFFGISLGGVYALMASGLTLVFGVMNIVNLSHGAFILIGAYISLAAYNLLGLDPILSLLITTPLLFLFGMGVYRLLFARIAESSRFVESTVLITFALALVVEGVLSFLFTGIYRSTQPGYATQRLDFGPLYFPEGQFYATVISVGLLAALGLFLRFSKTGYAIRATMQNRTAARTVGVDVDWTSTISFGIGTGLGGAAGSLASFLFTFYPALHWDWVAILMALIVLGGMGSLLGALVGAFLLSIVAAFIGHIVGPVWSTITFFLALFVILLIRPQGLFGRRIGE